MVEVSVIVPAYNAEKFIQQTIDSLLNQSFKNCEFIFVNDGSKDNTLKILEENKSEDARIVIVNTDNHGISHARNVGIEKAKGKYILFLDADDILISDSLEVMISAIKENKADIVIGKYITFSNADYLVFTKDDVLNSVVLNKFEMQKLLSECKKIENHVWGKLFKKTIFNNFRFNDNYRIWEDVKEMYKVIDLCSTGVLLNKTIVMYRVNELSLSKQLSIEKINEFCIAQANKADFYLTTYPELARYHCESMFQCAAEVVTRRLEKKIDYYKHFLKTYKKVTKKSGFKNKIKYFIIKYKFLNRLLLKTK